MQSDLWSCGITAIEMAEGAPRKYHLPRTLPTPHNCMLTPLIAQISYKAKTYALCDNMQNRPKKKERQHMIIKCVREQSVGKVWPQWVQKCDTVSGAAADGLSVKVMHLLGRESIMSCGVNMWFHVNWKGTRVSHYDFLTRHITGCGLPLPVIDV